MELIEISASPRNESGKGPARRLRASGVIPAVAYGQKMSVIPLSVSPKDVVGVLHSELGRNSLLDLRVEGQSPLKVMLKDYQYHPVSRQLLHVDFVQIQEDRPVDVEVPFELTGRPKGVVMGGTLHKVFRTLPVTCLPKDVPARLEHDVTPLDLEQYVTASELVLPEGVSVRLRPNQTIAGVVGGKKVTGEEEEEAAEEKPAAK